MPHRLDIGIKFLVADLADRYGSAAGDQPWAGLVLIVFERRDPALLIADIGGHRSTGLSETVAGGRLGSAHDDGYADRFGHSAGTYLGLPVGSAAAGFIGNDQQLRHLHEDAKASR